jgi:Protein of unknown function (DUF4231)
MMDKTDPKQEDSLVPADEPEETTPVHSPGRLVSKSAAQIYISKKLDPQRKWFDEKATRSKLFHYSLLGASMVATASIVVANSFHFPALSTALAVVATITTGLSGMVKYQEHWIRYRNTATALEALKLRYEVGLHPFEGPDKHGQLIEEAEKIFEKEQSQWAAKSAENTRPPANLNYPV